MPGHRVWSFAVETEQAEQAAFCRAMAVGGIGEGMGAGRVECAQYRALLIGRQQGGIDLVVLVPMLRQQLIIVLEQMGPDCALYFSGQAAFAVKALEGGRLQ
ncbi:hypothetical protein D3C85_805940 [compost metagenome]